MVNVNNSFVGTPAPDGGVAFHAPVGTPLPATARAALNVAFKDTGAIGDNGLKWKFDRKTKKIKRFGGDTYRVVQEEFASGCTVTFLEDAHAEVEKIVFGSSYITKGSLPDALGLTTKILVVPTPLPIETWVFKCIDGQKTKLYAVEKAQVTGIKEFSDVHDNVTGYELDFDFYTSSDPSGCTVQILKNDAAITS